MAEHDSELGSRRRQIQKILDAAAKKSLLAKLKGLEERALHLMSVDFDEADQEIFDDEVVSSIAKEFGVQEENELRSRLVTPTRLYSPPRAALNGDRAKALGRVVNRLKVISARVERGDHVKSDPQPEQQGTSPKVFIAHSGEPPALQRLVRFLRALGTEPIIAEWLPFEGRQVPDQARHAMDGCAAAIVFATAADAVGERGQPGRGVLTETGILQERFEDKVIYLLEESASFGPMVDGFARESFTQDNLERAFQRIVIELKAHAIS